MLLISLLYERPRVGLGSSGAGPWRPPEGLAGGTLSALKSSLHREMSQAVPSNVTHTLPIRVTWAPDRASLVRATARSAAQDTAICIRGSSTTWGLPASAVSRVLKWLKGRRSAVTSRPGAGTGGHSTQTLEGAQGAAERS